MKFVRFKTDEDQLKWQREFARKGEITMFRSEIYMLTEEQFEELNQAQVDLEIVDEAEVDRRLAQPRRESA